MRRKIKDYYRYLLYLFFRFLFRITPFFILKPFLILCTKLISKFNNKHNKIIKANLDLVFGNTISEKRKSQIRYNSYKSLLCNMYEFIENQTASNENLLKKINFENENYIIEAIKNKRKIIFVTAHYGSWEIASISLGLKFGPLVVVNRKMDNPLINNLYTKVRNRHNIIMLEKKTAAKGLISALKKGNHIAVVIDQHLRDGIEIEFFNKKVLATDSTSRLAVKYDALIIPAFCVMNDYKDYVVKISKPIDVKEIKFKTDDKIKELTQIQYNLIENQIKENPDVWLWQHKRWKKFHNRIYKK